MLRRNSNVQKNKHSKYGKANKLRNLEKLRQNDDVLAIYYIGLTLASLFYKMTESSPTIHIQRVIATNKH